MRKYKSVLAFVAVLLGVPLLFAGIATATSFRSGDSVTLAQGEVVDSSLFAAGQSVEIAGEVNGDVYCAGNSVTVSGTVRGDVLCAGQTVDIRGTVEGDVRVAGQTVRIDAEVTGNVSVGGQTVTFGTDATARDFHGAGTVVALNGSVLRDADVAGSTVDINGKIGRDVNTYGEQVAVGGKANIGGNLVYTSRNNLQKTNGATIAGTTKHEIPKEGEGAKKDASEMFNGAKWFFALAALVTSLVLVALMPRWFYSVSERGVEQPLLSALSGVGVSIGAVVVAFLLLFTLLGLPLAAIIFVAWLLLLLLSIPVASFYLGRVLFSRSTNNLAYYMLGGAAIVFVVSVLPVLGGIFMLVASWFGVGMIVLELARRWSKPQYTLATTARRKKA